MIDACDQGDSLARWSKIYTGVTLVSAAATGYFLYKGYLSSSAQGTRATAAQLSPLVMPDTVGAELTLRF